MELGWEGGCPARVKARHEMHEWRRTYDLSMELHVLGVIVGSWVVGGEAEEGIWDQNFRNHIIIYLFLYVSEMHFIFFNFYSIYLS